MTTSTTVAIIVASYLVGCVSAGYYLVKICRGTDVREHGSGNVGARNVGRLLGPAGFAVTFLVDMAKGMGAVWLARRFGLDLNGTMLAALAAVAGHIWPVQLRLRGGKGVCTSLGALLMLDYRLVLIGLCVLIPLKVLTHQSVLSGMVVFALLPLIAFLLGHPLGVVSGLGVLAVVVVTAHRANLREFLHHRREAAERYLATKGVSR